MKVFLKKLTSRKFLIALWSVIMITIIIVQDKTDCLRLAELLSVVPFAYSGLNVWQKKKELE